MAVRLRLDICDKTGAFPVSMVIKLHPLRCSVLTILLSCFLAEVDSQCDYIIKYSLERL